MSLCSAIIKQEVFVVGDQAVSRRVIVGAMRKARATDLLPEGAPDLRVARGVGCGVGERAFACDVWPGASVAYRTLSTCLRTSMEFHDA